MTPAVYVVLGVVTLVHLALAWLRVPDPAEHAITFGVAVLALLTPTRSAHRATDVSSSSSSKPASLEDPETRALAEELVSQWAKRDPSFQPDKVMVARALEQALTIRDLVQSMRQAPNGSWTTVDVEPVDVPPVTKPDPKPEAAAS